MIFRLPIIELVQLSSSLFSSAVSKLNNNPIASWDTKFEMGTKTLLLQPFSPIVVAADENERIRYGGFLLFICSCKFLLNRAVNQCGNR